MFLYISVLEKVGYYLRSLKLSIHEEILETLRHMISNMRCELIKISRIVAAKGHPQRTLIKHAQPSKSATKSSEKFLSTFLTNDTPDTPLLKSNFPGEQGLER